MGSHPTSSTPTPVAPDVGTDMDMKLRSSSTGESTYGYSISSSPPSLSPTNTLTSLNPYTTNNSTSNTTGSTPTSTTSRSPSKEHHSTFPFLFSYSRSKSPRPPPPTEISTPSTNTTLNPPKQTQTQPILSRKFPHPSSPTQRRHRSEGTMQTITDLHTNTIATTSSGSNTPAHSPTATSPSSPDALRRDNSWIQKKSRTSSGSSPGGYGRHGDEWLFGSISLTQTARELVARRAKKRDGSSSSSSS